MLRWVPIVLLVAAFGAGAMLAPTAAAQSDEGTQITPSPTPTADPCAEPSPSPSIDPSPTTITSPDVSEQASESPQPSESPQVSPSPLPCPSPTAPPEDNLGPRPYGLEGLKKMFGKRCNRKANDARTFMPHAWGRKKDGYVYYHAKLLPKVAYDIATPLLERRKHNAFDYGIWGYACRMKTGGTSWSVHSWGAAIDTNTLRNPYGQTYWDGRGANGRRFGRLIPNVYMSENFYWGLNFNDPMHFQYVSGY